MWLITTAESLSLCGHFIFPPTAAKLEIRKGNPLWLDLCPYCLYVSLIKTLSPLPAYSLLIHSSIYSSCMALPNQGPSNWVVKGAAGGEAHFITRYAQKSMHPLKWLSLYGPSGKYEWKWRSGRAVMWYKWRPSFRVLPPSSKQTLTRRVPLVKAPLSLSPLCAVVQDFVPDYWT